MRSRPFRRAPSRKPVASFTPTPFATRYLPPLSICLIRTISPSRLAHTTLVLNLCNCAQEDSAVADFLQILGEWGSL